MAIVGVYALAVLWNVLVMGTIAYAVFWRDASGLWFLLGFILLCDLDTAVTMAEKVKS